MKKKILIFSFIFINAAFVKAQEEHLDTNLIEGVNNLNDLVELIFGQVDLSEMDVLVIKRL